MKRIFYGLFFLIAVLTPGRSLLAQAHLVIDTIYNMPDTAVMSQSYPLVIQVSNTGNTPYQGTLQIGLRRDSIYSYLYFNQNPVVIFPALGTAFSDSSGFTFDPSVFKPGNNVVVVWPYSNQGGVLIDSLTFEVYVTIPAGIATQHAANPDLRIFPNPFVNELQCSGLRENRIECVRIMDLQGRIRFNQGYPEFPLSVPQIPDGIYIIELQTPTERLRYRMIRAGD